MDYYSVEEIKNLEELKKYFPTGDANVLNFVLFSTGGVHGYYQTLESIEKGEDMEEDQEENLVITILYIQPRTVRILYGTIEINKEDIPYLKKLRQSSLDIVSKIGFD